MTTATDITRYLNRVRGLPRLIRVIPEPAVTVCPDHGSECYSVCFCACGVDRRALHEAAACGGPMDLAQQKCWQGRCGR